MGETAQASRIRLPECRASQAVFLLLDFKLQYLFEMCFPPPAGGEPSYKKGFSSAVI